MTIVTCFTVLRTANEGLVLLRSANLRNIPSDHSALTATGLGESQLTPTTPKEIKYPKMTDIGPTVPPNVAVEGTAPEAPIRSGNKTEEDSGLNE